MSEAFFEPSLKFQQWLTGGKLRSLFLMLKSIGRGGHAESTRLDLTHKTCENCQTPYWCRLRIGVELTRSR